MAITRKSFTNQPQIIPVWLIILLLLFFPPAAWYFMWKINKYRAWFPFLLWINGGVTLIFLALYYFITLPKLQEVYADFNVPQKPGYPLWTIIVTSVFALIQIGFGMYLWNKLKTSSEIPQRLLWITVAILIVGFIPFAFAPAFVITSMVLPIYNLTSQLK